MYTFIDSFIVYLKVEKNASPRTQESYQRDIWQFVDFMADEFKVSGERVRLTTCRSGDTWLSYRKRGCTGLRLPGNWQP